MADRLFVGVLGHQDAGKSETWNALFGHKVKTGKYSRHLPLGGGECVDVFLVSGSNEERKKYAGDVLANQNTRIVLCSVQYAQEAQRTFDYAFDAGFTVAIQWINPGYHDAGQYYDRLGFGPQLLHRGATMSLRDGGVDLSSRVQEIRETIYGWAAYRDLIFPC